MSKVVISITLPNGKVVEFPPNPKITAETAPKIVEGLKKEFIHAEWYYKK